MKEGFARRLQRFRADLYEDIVWQDGEVGMYDPALVISNAWRTPDRRLGKGRRALAPVLVRMIKRLRASDGCLGIERL